jgi:hypothetical protein
LNENKPWLPYAKYFFKVKNASKNILIIFFVSEVFKKDIYFRCDNLSLTHVLIKQIFRAAEQAPPSPPHQGLCGGL